MAVLSSELVSQTGGQAGDYVWTHTRSWLVKTSADSDGDYTVITGGQSATPDPLPSLFAAHPENSLANCKSLTAQRKGDSRTVWEVTAQYDSQTGDDTQNPQNPELIPPEISWSTVHRDVVVETDFINQPIVNSIGDQFDEPVLKDGSTLQLNITVQRFNFDGAFYHTFMDTLNVGAFYGGASETVKLSAIHAVAALSGTTLVWKITFEFHYRKEGWNKKILNRGLMHRVVPGGEPVANTPSIVMNLRHDGTLLPRLAPLEPPLEFIVYEAMNFSLLGVGG